MTLLFIYTAKQFEEHQRLIIAVSAFMPRQEFSEYVVYNFSKYILEFMYPVFMVCVYIDGKSCKYGGHKPPFLLSLNRLNVCIHNTVFFFFYFFVVLQDRVSL